MENNSRKWERWSGWRVGMQREWGGRVENYRETEKEVGGKMSQLIYLPVSMTTGGLSHPLSPYSLCFAPTPAHSLLFSLTCFLLIPPDTQISFCLYLSSLCFFYFIDWRHENLPCWKCNVMFLMTSFKHVNWKVQLVESWKIKLYYLFRHHYNCLIPMIVYSEKKCRWAYNKSKIIISKVILLLNTVTET